MLNLVSWIVLGGLVGWAASVAMGRRQQGCLMDVLVGVAGAFVGGAVLNLVRGQEFQFTGDLSLDAGSLFTAFLGAVILLAVLRALR
jgi:uncharacterized membrane protein YeaQ/YmgE (transglycosylase-associated protein family)